jgi:hypothetical protein
MILLESAYDFCRKWTVWTVEEGPVLIAEGCPKSVVKRVGRLNREFSRCGHGDEQFLKIRPSREGYTIIEDNH